VTTVSALANWQKLHGVDDHEAARQLGLEAHEYCRQKATRPSRQTALLALFETDMGKIAAARGRRPRPPSRRAGGT
jgi:hypothetical protein